MAIKVYDYKCEDCEHVWEAWVDVSTSRTEVNTSSEDSRSELETVACEKCKSERTRRLPSSPPFSMNKTPYEEFL